MIQAQADAHATAAPSSPISPFHMLTPITISAVEMARLRPSEILNLKEEQAVFDRAFPPLRTNGELLIVSWDEIERQFMSLAAPWDRTSLIPELKRARQVSVLESPEKTLRWLFVLARGRCNFDEPEPIWGTGESYPMP